VAPQLMPPTLLVTVPLPAPIRETDSVRNSSKFAVTVFPPSITTAHVPVPLHPPPLHPVKTEPGDAVAVRVIVEPSTICPLQVEPQLIVVAGLLVTVPVPVPVLLMVSRRAGAKVAVTFVAASIVTWHVPVPLHPPPLHPVNRFDAFGVAVSVTTVPPA
jgi:hypothetical protein